MDSKNHFLNKKCIRPEIRFECICLTGAIIQDNHGLPPWHSENFNHTDELEPLLPKASPLHIRSKNKCKPFFL